ncbi:hypothetical protein [Pelagovum pacificum]|uniref:Uncharacterized protein n=1 Tax=Pelagovum pacificum TaxID=2588711 RepID=A0A5C5GI29_9RHOB|nr:hypothetical protein [Pelagovum pacificum]QQA43294.1 hypothetical protein I8N54_01610 [Pelagovum pacificum]TNY33569.1 hypothetical protein FHY64_09915 [Pelagovum pacificum]
MTPNALKSEVEEVRGLLRQKFGVSGPTLTVQLRRVGRLLPRPLRRDGARLAQAAQVARHPRAGRQIDLAGARQAQQRLVFYLEGIDPEERRRMRHLSIVATIVGNLLVVAAFLIAVLAWRGFL